MPFKRLTYGGVTVYIPPVKTFMFLVMAAFMMLIAIGAHASATNVVSDVVSTLNAANAVSAPFNPFAPLIAALLQVASPLAMFLAGVFSHRAGVNAKLGGVK